MAVLTSRAKRNFGSGLCKIFLKHKNHHSWEERKNIFSDDDIYLFVRIVDTEIGNRLLVFNFQPVQVHRVHQLQLVLP